MASTDATLQSARFLDLSSRVLASTAVVASPADATETIVASVALPSGLTINSGVLVLGWIAYTVGTTGASGTARIRQTSVSGTTVVSSGAVSETAANLDEVTVAGFDASPGDAQVYKLTLTVASATAGSTVSAVLLAALAV